MDIYMEYIIKRKRGPRENILTLAIILSVPSLVFFAIMLALTPLAPFVIILIAAIIVLAYYLITRLNVEFEYIITNNELDIDKITAKKTRKRIITIDLKKIDIVAPVTTNAHQHELSTVVSNTIHADRGVYDNAYFVNFSKDGQTYRVFLTPTKKMVDTMKIFAPGKVFEE